MRMWGVVCWPINRIGSLWTSGSEHTSHTDPRKTKCDYPCSVVCLVHRVAHCCKECEIVHQSTYSKNWTMMWNGIEAVRVRAKRLSSSVNGIPCKGRRSSPLVGDNWHFPRSLSASKRSAAARLSLACLVIVAELLVQFNLIFPYKMKFPSSFELDVWMQIVFGILSSLEGILSGWWNAFCVRVVLLAIY